MDSNVTQTENALVIRKTLNAPQAAVFKAWTESAALKKWWAAGPGMTTPFAEVDLRVGGKYRLAMQAPNEKEPYIVAGKFTEVKAPEKLAYTWSWEGPHGAAGESLVTVEFRARGSKTDLVLTHSRLPAKDAVTEHLQGWQGCLDNLAKLVEQ